MAGVAPDSDGAPAALAPESQMAPYPAFLSGHPAARDAMPKARAASVDAYRGAVMFLMLAEILRTCDVAGTLPYSRFWSLVCFEQTHAAWVGWSLHDLIQPSFYFLVGMGLLFSRARRIASGQTMRAMAGHMVIRSLALIVLGMVVVAIHPRQWIWGFTDTLTQIGLAYPVLFVVALRPKRDWYVIIAAILAGYWLWFALTPLPPSNFDYQAAGVSSDWLSAHGLTGFGAHWQKNSNVACLFDRWLLNLFPRSAPYTGDSTGLTTLNFVPSIGTMILGMIAGDMMMDASGAAAKLRRFVVTGVALFASGWILGWLGVCPVVKAIWTPSWVLLSAGLCFLLLAAFYAVVDVAGARRVAFPLIVIGMNSIVAYCMAHFYPALAFNSLRRVAGDRMFRVVGDAYEPFIYGAAVLLMYWVILYALYRRRIFVRI